jgi:uncharacterized membrane protein YqhA
LLAAAALIFALGLYELFVDDLDEARANRLSSKILVVHSLDDLKSRLGKVILMILIVSLFEQVSQISFGGPLDLLYLALSIALIGLALYLSHAAESSERVAAPPKRPLQSD